MAIKHNCDDYDEDKYTKMAMSRYGIDNVRGGSYCQAVLPKHVKDVLEREIRGAADKCFKCGKGGHFANDCAAARQDKAFNAFNSKDIDKPNRQTKPKTVICFRCDRKGHYANECIVKLPNKGITTYDNRRNGYCDSDSDSDSDW